MSARIVAARRGAARAAILATVAAVVPLPLRAQTVAITGGRVFPVSGAPIDGGTVLMRNGKIVAVGASVTIPGDAERVDATGKWVTPGLFNAATQLGLVEVGLVPETRQTSARVGERGVNAAFTVWDGFNPASVLLAAARNEGITTAMVAPNGGLIAGQAGIVDITDGTLSDMLIKSPAAMVGQIGNPGAAGNLQARGELLVRLRELLDDTRAYLRNRAAYERAETRQYAASRIDLEAMIPVVQGRLPFALEAHKASDIEAALKLAKDYNLKLVLTGAAEAWMVADEIVAAKVPVMAGALNNIPTSFATLGQMQENPGLLRRAGVQVILIGTGADPDAFNVRNIKQEAGNAVAYGMTWDDALRAITLAPAEVFGVADRVGSLAPGREGNVVVWSGDPFEFGTRAEHVFVRGRRLMSPSRQDMLMERYKQNPPDYRKP